MQWRIVHLVLIVIAAAIMFAILRSFWGPAWQNARIVFGAYLVCAVTASIAAYQSEPRWRRPWLGYAAFCWSWLIMVLRHYLGMVPDVYAPNLIVMAGAVEASLGRGMVTSVPRASNRPDALVSK